MMSSFDEMHDIILGLEDNFVADVSAFSRFERHVMKCLPVLELSQIAPMLPFDRKYTASYLSEEDLRVFGIEVPELLKTHSEYDAFFVPIRVRYMMERREEQSEEDEKVKTSPFTWVYNPITSPDRHVQPPDGEYVFRKKENPSLAPVPKREKREGPSWAQIASGEFPQQSANFRTIVHLEDEKKTVKDFFQTRKRKSCGTLVFREKLDDYFCECDKEYSRYAYQRRKNSKDEPREEQMDIQHHQRCDLLSFGPTGLQDRGVFSFVSHGLRNFHENLSPTFSTLRERADEVFDVTKVEVKSHHSMIDGVNKVMALFTILLQSQTWSDVGINFMASIAMLGNEKLYAIIESFISLPSLTQQSTPIQSFRAALNSAKLTCKNPDDIPGFSVFKKCIMVAAAVGMRPANVLHDTGLMTDLVRGWERQGILMRKMDALDYAMDICLFTHEMIVLAERNVPLWRALLPRTLETRYSSLKNLLPLYKGGKLDRDRDGYGMQEYVQEVSMLKSEASTALAQSRGAPFSEAEASRRLFHYIGGLHTEVKMAGVEVHHKEAAFGIMLYGETSVGKTTVTNIMREYFGSHGGYPHSAELNTFYANSADAYDSNMTENRTIVVFDDVGNAKVGEHLLSRGIAMMNNAPMDSVQADVELKGKIPYKFKLGIGTTNFHDARVKEVSAAPISLLRRFVWLEVTCPHSHDGKFDGENVYDSAGNFREQHYVREYNFSAKTATSQNYVKHYVGEAMPLSRWLEKRGSSLHTQWMDKQANYMRTVSRKDTFTCCPHDRVRAFCPECTMEEQFSKASVTPTMVSAITWIANIHLPVFDFLVESVPRVITQFLVPPVWNFLLRKSRNALWSGCFIGIQVFTVYTFVLWRLFNKDYATCFSAGILLFYLYTVLVRTCRSFVSHTIESGIRSGGGLAASCILGHMGVMYFLGRRLVKSPLINQTQSLEATIENIDRRRKADDLWKDQMDFGPAILPEGKIATMSFDQVKNVVRKSVGRIQYTTRDGSAIHTNYTQLSPREVVVPAHWAYVVQNDNCDAVLHFYRSTRRSTLMPFKAAVESWRYHESADLAILVTSESPGGGSLRPLVASAAPSRSVSALLMVRSKDFEIQEKHFPVCEVHIGPSSSSPDAVHSPGLLYEFTQSAQTYKGDCGAPLISTEFPHVILGFHVGGGVSHGFSHVARLSGFTSAEPAKLGKRTTQSFTEIPFPDMMEMENVEDLPAAPTGTELDSRNMFRFVPIDAISPTTLLAVDEGIKIAPKTEVRKTYLYDSLEKNLSRCKFEAPKINANRSGSEYLQIAFKGMSPISPSLVMAAVDDVSHHALVNMAPGYLPEGDLLRNMHTALNGIPNNRFAKPMKRSTAAGVYLPGKKAKYLEEEIGENGCITLHPTPILQRRVNDLLDRYMKGYTTCPIVRSACKDEPVMKEEFAGKKKIVRQFMVFPMEHLIVGRMLFSATCEAIAVHPLVLGSLHGCNTNTEDWTTIYSHFFQGRESSVMEGDYSKWDVRVNGQLIRAAGTVLVYLANKFGASQAHLTAMRAYIEDLALSYFSYNGILMSHSGWNPSGHGFTIEFNSICNLLLHVCAYHYTAKALSYRSYPRFFDVVSMAFMGDDSAGSSRVSWFNMHAMEIFCRDHGMKYTAGDKSEINSDHPFLRDGTQVSFCKRKWRWDTRRRLYVAPLDIDSIVKPLFLRMRNASLSDCSYIRAQLTPTWLELGKHSKDVFDNYTYRIASACLEQDTWYSELEISYSEVQERLDEAYSDEYRNLFEPLVVDQSLNKDRYTRPFADSEIPPDIDLLQGDAPISAYEDMILRDGEDL